ncbi:hypothetical protein SNEBB_004718, partial [Seison nebaliae]
MTQDKGEGTTSTIKASKNELGTTDPVNYSSVLSTNGLTNSILKDSTQSSRTINNGTYNEEKRSSMNNIGTSTDNQDVVDETNSPTISSTPPNEDRITISSTIDG